MNDETGAPLVVIYQSILMGIGFALGAAVVAILFRALGVRWVTA